MTILGSLVAQAGVAGEAARAGGYQIERSLRFNSADTAYLSRTPASAGNRKTWTWSGWVKRSALGVEQTLFSTNVSTDDATNGIITFTSGDQLNFQAYGSVWRRTTQLFRDPSAWYHFVVVLDTTQATGSNRVKLYVNGVQITAFATNNDPTQNSDQGINQAAQHTIGRYDLAGGGGYLSGYLTEINFIDGSALDPTSFGEFNAITGVWQPKAYEGEYGTNGFYLNFSDNSTTDALGTDFSGNDNTWDDNGFSVTAGADNDSLVDTPTNYGTDTGVGGEVRGNYCTLNPLSKTSPATISNGNLDVSTTSSSANISVVGGTLGVSSGKWYWEVVGTAVDGGRMAVNVCDADKYGTALLSSTGAYGYVASNGNKIQGDGTNWFGSSSAYGDTWTTNDVIGVALDLDNGKIWFSKNGTWQASGDPVAGTNAAFTGVSGNKTCGMYLYTEGSATTAVFNLGQRPFAYTAPSGFKALCTQNLPEPTIVDGGEYFNTVLYTGNGSTQSITGVGFQPDWLWLKTRSATGNHAVWDSVRGVSARLRPSSTSAEDANVITSFNADGFTLGTEQNVSNTTYVAWNWVANGAGVSNTDGTITSTVSANTDSGFSIVSWTGTGSSGTVGHGLSQTPNCIITKNRTGDRWVVWHSGLGDAGYWLELNSTDAVYTSFPDRINNVGSTTFQVYTQNETNGLADGIIGYCFHSVPGYSSFGSWVGNGSADGPFVFTGHRPAFIMWKRTDSSTGGAWVIQDTERRKFNPMETSLYPNLTNAEATGETFRVQDTLSNGFKIRASAVDINASGGTYIFMSFASNPFKYSLAR